MAKPEGDHARMLESGRWKEAVQAYLATISYCDAQIGRLLDAYDKSPHKDNTIIVLWGDHGWHLGEKEHWRKFALWEEATRMPYIWVVPGVTKPGGVCERPVDLMSLYPTLCDLANVPLPKHVQGEDIRPLLADPSATWNKPAITTFHRNNHAIRTERWRYIHYADGGEELYDHDKDPYEWTNLANDPAFASVKERPRPPDALGEQARASPQPGPGGRADRNEEDSRTHTPGGSSSECRQGHNAGLSPLSRHSSRCRGWPYPDPDMLGHSIDVRTRGVSRPPFSSRPISRQEPFISGDMSRNSC